MAALKLNVIVLAAVFAPPLPVIIRVGQMLLVTLILPSLKIQPKLAI
jgi:uncharacterized membrane protein YqaE (UPF0057 family)